MDGEFTVQKLHGHARIILALNFLQPPYSSTRPHVLGYNVSHNASGTVRMYDTTETNFDMESASPNLFALTVAAVNILGAGKESDITSEFSHVSVFVMSVYKITPNKLEW